MKLEKIKGSLENSKTTPSPVIECYVPEGENKTCLIIFPGGGYGGLAEHEGKGYAEYFSKKNIACFVVYYRLGNDGYKHPAMLEDGLSAIYTVRKLSEKFGVSPGKIGVIGSSAGGHLAATTLVHFDKYESSVSLRPDFGILCYPVITMDGKYCHMGSRENLIGKNPSKKLIDFVSCEKNVSSKTPPCFIWHTFEDDAVPVENSLLFASALREKNVPFQLHIYQKGRHGLGLNATFNWAEECLRWINLIFQE